jgi:2',3'-cyclic-nucleotide 2'-phosphodiesterase (5'-nucleotidase family)
MFSSGDSRRPAGGDPKRKLMGYNALNLGSPEFNFGKEFLEHTRSKISFPYIASNLLYGGSRNNHDT